MTVQDMTFNNNQQSLSCISTGGPPTSTRWIKDNKLLEIDGITYNQSQTLINGSTSTYITTLFMYPQEQVQIAGNYTCVVNNSRVVSHGKKQIMAFEIYGKCTYLM